MNGVLIARRKWAGLYRDGGALRDFSLRSKWELGSVFAGFGAGFAFGGGGGVYEDATLET